MLKDPSYNLVVLDELTYMIAYDYLPEEEILQALANRPREQSVVVTGRGGGSKLQEIMDTVSEVKDIKHAFNNGIKARKGVDY
jgi:cob(I)alamin adenosyltransferase